MHMFLRTPVRACTRIPELFVACLDASTRARVSLQCFQMPLAACSISLPAEASKRATRSVLPCHAEDYYHVAVEAREMHEAGASP